MKQLHGTLDDQGAKTSPTGVHIGWMLGPVTLAPSRDHVAQYVAIHTTLVGVRGIVAQGLGVLIYTLTGSFNR